MADGRVVALCRRGIIIAMLLIAGFDQIIISESEEQGEIAELRDAIGVAHVLGRTQDISRITTVDSVGSVGYYTSLAVDSEGDVHISYRDATNTDLKYATYNGTAWTSTTVDSVGSVGYYTSLAVDSGGDVHISYYDFTNGDLKYATYNGTAWTNTTVDSTGNVGEYTSLAVDSGGDVHISYYDDTNDDLKYVTTKSADAIYPEYISAGWFHTCAIDQFGDLWCWGKNDNYQLGDGTNSNRAVPTKVSLPQGRTATSVTGGWGHTCALADNGSVFCWGLNGLGRLGNGNTSTQQTPVQTILPRQATVVSIGDEAACALLDNGSVMCWGRGSLNALGNGDSADKSTPVYASLPVGRHAIHLSAGRQHACAVMDNGSAMCWGTGGSGRLGNGETVDNNTPQYVLIDQTKGNFTHLAAAFEYTCGIRENGSVNCWGSASEGRLGNGATTGNETTPVMVQLPVNRTARVLSGGHAHTCAILDNGSAMCWGWGGKGQIGNGANGNAAVPDWVDLPVGRKATSITAHAEGHTCVLLDNHSAMCWGEGADNRLSTGSTTSINTPGWVVDIIAGSVPNWAVNHAVLDTDDDGYVDRIDSFPDDASEWEDSDGDRVGDNTDVFPNDANETVDTDGDGVGDNADAFPNNASETADDDGDGVGNNADAFPSDASETVDTDADGVGDNADAFPSDANETVDTDGDGVGDNADAFPSNASETLDTDGDGVGDNADAFPSDASETIDTDSDGVGDNADAFPNNASETADDDGDGVGNNSDAFPSDANETLDTDSDGVGDNADEFPNDGNETVDTDGDGVGDNADAFPSDANETLDTDSDGVGDNADEFPSDGTETVDTDGDGVGDNGDAFPNNASETADDDGDGVGNNSDAFPNDANETVDTDGDLIGDNADPDDDNDGWLDLSEVDCLTDPKNHSSVPLDSDLDGTCDALEDDDNDGFDNAVETLCGSDPSDNLSVPEDLDSDGICDPEDGDVDGDSWSDVDESECGTDPRNNGSAPSDADGDGDCNAIDGDDDNDGVIDEEDRFPFNALEWSDMDDDGLGDNTDPDDDNDGIGDGIDPFPFNGSEWSDVDEDGVGDNADLDDDNDGTPDDVDVFPLDSCASQDTDTDGFPDTIESDCTTSLKEDLDDDGDGVNDLEDLFPLDGTEWEDDDGDGIGNNQDTNDDRITETPDAIVNETNESVDPGVPFLYNATALSKHQSHAEEGEHFSDHFWVLRDLQVEPGMKIIVNGHISTIIAVDAEDGFDYISQVTELQFVQIDQAHPVPFYHGDTIEFYGYVTETIPEQPQTSIISLDLELREWVAVAGGSGVLGTILAIAWKARKAVRGDDEERMEKKLKEKKSSIPIGWSKEQYEKYGRYGNFSTSSDDDER